MLKTGFIAQEVEQAAKDIGYDFDGVNKPQNEQGAYGLSYASFVVPLVKAIQEQQALINEFENILQRQQKIIDNLQKDIADLKYGIDSAIESDSDSP